MSRALSIALAFVALLNLAQDVPANGPPPAPERLYNVGGGFWRNDHYVALEDVERLFETYDEAHAYVRRLSRRYPNMTFALGRIVSYDAPQGVVYLGVPLTEDDTLEWWEHGHCTLRTFPQSRACGDAVAVRAHIMAHRCED